MLNTHSLGATVNAVNEAFLFGERIPKSEASRISTFIASRQGLPGNYGGLFAPAEGELVSSYRLFTGDSVVMTASAARHILGEESLRILKVLDICTPAVQGAIQRAQDKFGEGLAEARRNGYGIGTFCCGKCTVAYWRALTTGWIADAEERIRAGMVDLAASRQNGKWRRYPFYYTVHCLCDLPRELANAERKYIQPSCERALKGLKPNAEYYQQKSAILENLLEVT